MTELPRGTVTFLFTDIEGSTKLWQQFPNAMPAALARHHEILQRAIEAHNGYVFQIIGDAFCAAFATAFDGLDAALDAQRALRDFAWGETGAIRVRMALHTGAAEVRAGEFTSGEYVSGYTLSRAARLLGAGHGGQILLSEPTAALVREQLPPNTALLDKGAHRLKDLVQPQQIFQILASDLAQEFPVLKTLDALPNNLPIQLTSFVGREKEIERIRELLHHARLLTLTGAGGSGKTRLSLQVAADVIDEYEKGAWFVELAPIADASLVPNAVMNALELREEAGRAPLDALTDFLRAKKLLLVLDNCEHLIEACAQLAHHLLTHCPKLKILATSREALGVAGEVTYQVPVLGLPDPKNLPSLESLSQYDAVKLFVERAISVHANFSVTNANAPAVAQICFRLDGIPLAIELAAARIKLFSPEQIAARLDDRFRLLASGSRTALPRQQTLRGAIDWSYSLLSEQERVLFRRLSVFVGGWSFEAAENVCAGYEIDAFDILELLSHLVDKSLVTTETRGDETRYRMLETIREYAFEKLHEHREADVVRTKHLEFFVSFGEAAEPKIRSREQAQWLNRLDLELDNLRGAIAFGVQGVQVFAAMRLVVALNHYWQRRAYFREGENQIRTLISLPQAQQRSILRAKALCVLGAMNGTYANLPFVKEALIIAREFDDSRTIAEALLELGHRGIQDPRVLLEESLGRYRSLGDEWHTSYVLRELGTLIAQRAAYETAKPFMDEAMIIAEQIGDPWLLGRMYEALGVLAISQQQYDRAKDFVQEALNISRDTNDKYSNMLYLNLLGEIARIEKNFGQAKALYDRAGFLEEEYYGENSPMILANQAFTTLHLDRYDDARAKFSRLIGHYQKSNNLYGMVFAVMGLAAVKSTDGSHQTATRLMGFVMQKIEAENLIFAQADKVEIDRVLVLLQEQLDEDTFQKLTAEGHMLTLEQAIELALSDP